MGWQDAPLAQPAQAAPDKAPAWKAAPALPQGNLANAVEKIESNHNPNAVNPKSGAMGSMQTMKGTLRDPGYGVAPAKDSSPEEMARVGRDYLGALRTKYGNDSLALAAYNWGPGHVDRLVAGGLTPDKVGVDAFLKHLPAETQSYITKISAQQAAPQSAPAPAAPAPAKPAWASAPIAQPPAQAPAQAPQPVQAAPVAPQPAPVPAQEQPQGIMAKLASMSEPSINAAANLESGIIAPFLSPKSLEILKSKGLYTPGESPVKEFSQATYGTLMSPLNPIVEAVTGAGQAAGKAAGLSDKAMNNIGGVLSTAMDVAGVAGIPGAKEAPKAAEIPVAKAAEPAAIDPKAIEKQMVDLEKQHDATQDPAKQEQIKGQMMELVNQIKPKAAEPAWKAAPVADTKAIEGQMAELERKHDASQDPAEQAQIKDQMMNLVNKIPEKPSGVPESSIFTPDEGIASTKELASTRGIADRLFAEKNRMSVDQAELGKWAEQFKDVPKATWEKFNDHMDDPKGVPLTPHEQTVFDHSIGALEKERAEAQKIISKAGYTPEDVIEEPAGEKVGGATRQVVGKGTPMDRLLGIKSGSPVSGKSLSRSASSFKPRSMKVIEEDGKRTVVHVRDDGTIVNAANPEQVMGHTSQSNLLKDATQKEIEAATEGRIKYHKNSLGVQVTSLLQERRAARNIKLLQELPKAPGAESVLRPPMTKGKNIPNGWVEIPNMPAFRGYHFEPEFAEEVQDHFNAVKKKDGLLKAMESTNNFMKSAFFWLNPAHAYNVAEAFAVSKGAMGFVKDLPSLGADFAKSLKSVVTRDKMYLKGARAGVPYRGLDAMETKFNRGLLQAMGERARQDPQNFLQFAKEFGFNKPADLIKRVGEISHDVPFGLQDILQQTLERQYARKGVGQAEATEKIARTLPDYRTKARYLNQRVLGQLAKGSAFLQFPGWDIGRLSGMANMLKDASKLNPKALDQLLMIAVLYEFGTQVIDPLVKQATGNPNAEGPTSGYGSLVKAGKDIYTGEKSVGQAAQSIFPTGYLPRAIDALRGTNPYTGQKTTLPGETPKEIAYDYAKGAAEQLDPVKRIGNMMSGKTGLAEEGWRQLGIKSPSDVEMNSKQKAMNYAIKELNRKRAKEPDWIAPK